MVSHCRSSPWPGITSLYLKKFSPADYTLALRVHFNQRSYVTVKCRRTFGVVFPILKERRQLCIHCSDSE